MTTKRSYVFSLAAFFLLPSLSYALDNQLLPSPSVLPDIGSGTVVTLPTSADIVDFSDENGSYANQLTDPDQIFRIEDGLPLGTEFKINGRLQNFSCDVGPAASGILCDIGLTQERGATFIMNMEGTGALAGYTRIIHIPVSLIAENGPRILGDPVQDFDTEMVELQGTTIGDFDFDILTIRAGSKFGLPTSPGHTTLTRLGPPGSDFQIDSFFDISYQIDFQGAPGSILEGMSGSTLGNVTIYNSQQAVPEPGDLNVDGFVDAADAGIMFGNWGPTTLGYFDGNLNGDEFIDAADAGIMFANWTGDVGPATTTIPEPSSLLLAGLAGLLFGCRRRRV